MLVLGSVKKWCFRFFEENKKNCHFGPKPVQNRPFWAKMVKNAQNLRFFTFSPKAAHWNFLNFCTKPSLWSQKDMTVSIFWRKFKNGPFWPKLTQIWRKCGQNDHKWRFFAFLVSRPTGRWDLRSRVRPSVCPQRFFSETAHYFFLKLYSYLKYINFREH